MPENQTVKRPLPNRYNRTKSVCNTPGCKKRPQRHGLLCETCATIATLTAQVDVLAEEDRAREDES